MRAVLASIKPYWAEKIYSREKDVEVRKTAPSPESGCWDRHLTVYLYESGTGLVTGEFEMSGVEQVATPWFTGNTCLTDVQLKEYGPGRDGWSRGWMIVSATRYEVPRKLSDFFGLRKTKFGLEPVKLNRPPQSWCYVEELSR